MTTNRSRPPDRNWLPYVGLLTLGASVIWQAASTQKDVANNVARITKLEAKAAANDEMLTQMNLRGARNEDRLQFLVDQSKLRGR